MTVNEAMVEMRFSGVPEEDIEAIMAVCSTKGLTPQRIDRELEKRGLEKVFALEYDASESWYDGGSSAPAKPKASIEKDKK